jgi:hypothetical protein
VGKLADRRELFAAAAELLVTQRALVAARAKSAAVVGREAHHVFRRSSRRPVPSSVADVALLVLRAPSSRVLLPTSAPPTTRERDRTNHITSHRARTAARCASTATVGEQ